MGDGQFDTLNRFPDNKGRPQPPCDLIYDRLMVHQARTSPARLTA